MTKLIIGIVIGLIIVGFAVRHTDFIRQKLAARETSTTTTSSENEKGDISSPQQEAEKPAPTTTAPLLSSEKPRTESSNPPSETMAVTSDTDGGKTQGDGEKSDATTGPEGKLIEPAPARETQEASPPPEPIRLSEETTSDAASSTPEATKAADPTATISREQDIFYLSRYRFSARSKAEGFKSKVEKETGLPLVLHQVPSGDYEVGFAYTDEEDRDRKIKVIEEKFSIQILEPSS